MKQKLWRLYRSARLGSILALTLLWVALWGGRPSVGTFVLGFLIAAASVHLFPMPRAGSRLKIHPVWLCWLLLVFFHDLVVASFVVGFKAIRPSGVARGGRIVTVQLQGAQRLPAGDDRRTDLPGARDGGDRPGRGPPARWWYIFWIMPMTRGSPARWRTSTPSSCGSARRSGGLEPQEWEDA